MKINASGGIEAGDNVIAAAAPQFVLGKYNNNLPDAMTTPPTIRSEGVFIVGAGMSAANPKNAMRITPTGTILIQPAGDIDMGSYNNGERP